MTKEEADIAMYDMSVKAMQSVHEQTSAAISIEQKALIAAGTHQLEYGPWQQDGDNMVCTVTLVEIIRFTEE